MTPAVRRAIWAVALAVATAPSAAAQAPNLPVDESVREQSCKSLQGGTAGMPGGEMPSGTVPGGESPGEGKTQGEGKPRLYISRAVVMHQLSCFRGCRC